MNKYTKKMNAEGTKPFSVAAAQGTAAAGLQEADRGRQRVGEDEAPPRE